MKGLVGGGIILLSSKADLAVVTMANHNGSLGTLLFLLQDLLKPSLYMKILSINNFTTRLLSKLLSDLYTGVHLKDTKKFGIKVINRQSFHRKTVF